MPSDVLITPASSKVEFTDGSNATKTLRITGTSFSFDSDLGIGITSPTSKLNVLSTTSLSSVFKAEGVNGTLFEVTDDLSNSLMSVNTIGGLPVFEVFANNTIIAGQYSANDFVINGNKVGIGLASPSYKLQVSGSSGDQAKIGDIIFGSTVAGSNSITAATSFGSNGNLVINASGQTNQLWLISSSGNVGFGTFSPANKIAVIGSASVGSNYNTAAPTNGLIVEGSVGIGTTSPTQKLHLNNGVLRISGGGNDSTGEINLDNGTQYSGNSFQIRKESSAYWGIKSVASGNDLALFVDNNVNLGLYIKNGTGNIGINNTSPSAKLDIRQTSANTGLKVFTNDTGSAYIAQFIGYDNVLGDTTRMVVQAGGNVGIGTTTIGSRFVVNGGTVNTTTYTTSEARISDASLHLMKTVAGGIFESIRAMNADTTAGTTVRFIAASTSDPFNNTNGGKVFIDAIRTSTNMDLAFSLNDVAGAAPVERVRFMGSGSVGIGTVSPGRKLEVLNTANSPTYIRINNQDSGTSAYTGIDLQSYGGGWQVRVPASTTFVNPLQFSFNDVEKVRIQSDGNVGIGTTNPVWKLDVSGTGVRSFATGAVEPGFIVDYDSTNGYGGFFIHTNGTRKWRIGNVGDTSSNPALFIWQEGVGARMYFKNDGLIGVGTTSPAGKLDVYENSNAGHFSIVRNVNAGSSAYSAFFLGNNEGNNKLVMFTNSSTRTGDGGAGNSTIRTDSGKLYLGAGATQHILDTTGNVGIGNTSPNNKLAVSGSVSVGSGYNTAAPTNGLIVEGSVGIGVSSLNAGAKLHVVGNADIGDSTADTGIIVRHGNSSVQYGRIRFYDSGANNLHTIHSFPTAWQNGTFLSSSTGALNLTAYNGITFGSWNNIDAAFASNGTNYFKKSVGIGITSPSAILHANSTTSGATLIRADGTNGTLFSVVDDLSDSLMSVNNSAGLPVLEVFADDRVVMGQYGQNDFVLVNNKLGLGTNNPAYKLDINGTLNVSGNTSLSTISITGTINSSATEAIRINNNNGFISFYNSAASTRTGYLQGNTGNSVLLASENNALLQFAVGGTVRATINTNGNLGIGTTIPSAKLTIVDNVNGGTINLVGRTSDDTAAINFRATGDSSTYAYISPDTNEFRLYHNDGFMSFYPGGTEKWRITSAGVFESNNAQTIRTSTGNLTLATAAGNGHIILSNHGTGNVGIGTVSPSSLLNVSGTGTLGSVFQEKITNGTTTLALGTNATAAEVQSQGSVPLYLNYGGNNVCIVPVGSGNVGIGTTTPNAPLVIHSNSTQLKLQTSSGPTAYFSTISSLYDSTHPFSIGVANNNASTTEYLGIYADGGGSNNRVSFPNGNVGIGNTSPAYKLDVSGTINTSNFMLVSYPYGNAFPLQLNASSFLKANDYYYGMTINSGDVNYISGKFLINGGTYKRVELYGYENGIGYIPTVIPGGNVGIGTTNPIAFLNVVGNGIHTILRNTSATSYTSLRLYNDQANIFRALEIDYSGSSYSGSLVTNGPTGESASIGTTGAYPLALTTNNTARLVISGGGNIGIGVSNPLYTLQHLGSYAQDTGNTANAIGYKIGYYRATASQNVSGGKDFVVNGVLNGFMRITIGWANESGCSVARMIIEGNCLMNNNQTGYYFTGYKIVDRYYNNGLYYTLSEAPDVAITAPYNGNSSDKLTLTVRGADTAYTGLYPIVLVELFGNYLTTPLSITAAATTTSTSWLADERYFHTNNTARLFIKSDGNVGIGSITPTQRLTINTGAATNSGAIYPIRLSGGTMTSINDATGIQFIQRDANNDYGGYIRILNTQGNPNYLNPRLEFGVQDTDTNLFSSVTTKMVVTGGGNVGIGNTSPSAKLHVLGASYTTASAANNNVRFEGSGGNGLGFGTIDATSTYASWIQSGYVPNFATATYALLLNPLGGNVGVGMVNPRVLLDLAKANNVGQVLLLGETGANIRVGFGLNPSNAGMRIFSLNHVTDGLIEFGGISSTDGSTWTRHHRLGLAGANSFFNEQGGNVGIGTTIPSAKLQVIVGNAPGISLFSNNAAQYAYLQIGRTSSELELGVVSGSNQFFTGTVTGDAVIKQNSTGKLHLGYGSAAPAISIDSSNNVGIGVVSPNNKLHVNGSMSVGSGYNTAGPANGLIAQGSVGIGASSPNNKLTVQADASTNVSFADNSVGQLVIRGDTDTTKRLALGIDTTNNIGVIQAQKYGTGVYNLAIQPTGGNVGVGTASPSSNVHIVAASAITNTSLLRLDSGTTGFNGANDANTAYALTFDACSYKLSTSVVQRTGAEIQMLKSGSWNEAAGGTGTRASLVFKTNNGTIDSPSLSERMRIQYDGNVGIGITAPTSKLNVLSSVSLSSVFKAEGINGTLFEVTDDLSNSLMSVNTIGGLPVFEVFANNTIIAGQYGANDFVINGNKVGIGTANPSFKLDVNGTLGVNAGTSDGNWPFIVVDTNTAGGTNRYALNKTGAMGFNHADSYAQLQLVGANGAYIDFANSSVDDGDARIIYYSNTRFDFVYGTTMTINSTGVGIATTTPYTRAHVYGTLTVDAAGAAINNFTEGIRLGAATNGYSIVTFGANAAASNGQITNQWWIGKHGSDNSFNFNSQGGGDVFRILQNGNVGIGNTTPSYKLHVNGNGYFNGILNVNSNLNLFGGGDLIINDSDGTGAFNSFMDSGVGYIRIDDGGSANGTLNINSGTLFVGPSSGNVGVGTITPAYKLDVSGGSARVFNNPATNNWGLTIENTNTGGWGVSQYFRLYGYNSSPAAAFDVLQIVASYPGFGQADFLVKSQAQSTAATVMSLLGNGNVGVGTTNPLNKLHIVQSIPTGTTSTPTNTTLRLDSNSNNYLSFVNTVDNQTYAGLTFTDNNLGGYIVFRNYTGNVLNGSDSMVYGAYQDHIFQSTVTAINTGSEVMRIKGNGNVGIGSNAPNNKLHVNGSVSIGSSYNTAATTNGLIVEGSVGIGKTTIRLNSILDVNGSGCFGTSGYGFYIGTDGTGTFLDAGTQLIRMFAGQVERIRIATDGNIGIGITSPAARLHVNSTTSGATLLRADGTNGTLFSVVDDLSDSLMSVNNSAGLPVLEVFADDRVVAGQYGANDFVLVNNKLGLGTNNPQYELDIVGPGTGGSVNIISRIRSTASSNTFDTASVIAFTNTTTNTNAYSYIGSRIDLGSAGDNAQALVFATNATNALPTEKMRIKSDGTVGIGTASPSWLLTVYAASAPQFALSNATRSFILTNNSGDNLLSFNYGGANRLQFNTTNQWFNTGNLGIGTSSPAALLQVGTATPTAATGGIQFGDDTAARIYRVSPSTIQVSNNLTVGGTLTESSSIRYKENIQTISAPILPKLEAIRPVTYNKKDNPSNTEYGIIAEELNELFPELVNKNDNGEVESVNYSRLTVLLIKAVKELKQEIEILKNK